MNISTNIADMHQVVLKIDQDVSKIREDTGSQNRVVCGIRTLYHFSIHANFCLDSGQVSDLDYQEIRV